MFRITSLGLVALAITFPLSSAAQAGPEGCTYVRCFLSLQRDPPCLVQGAAATPIADFGMFAPHIDLLSRGSDSARFHYQAFRGDYNRLGAFKLIGIMAMVSSVAVLAGNPRVNYPTALGIFAVAVPSAFAGIVYGAKAQRELEQSIADYNRSLPDAR